MTPHVSDPDVTGESHGKSFEGKEDWLKHLILAFNVMIRG